VVAQEHALGEKEYLQGGAVEKGKVNEVKATSVGSYRLT